MKINLVGSKPRLAVLAAFFANGALTATWVSRIPTVQARLGLSEGALGLVLLASSTGIISALTVTSGLIARFGSRKTTLFGFVLMCVILPLLALAPNSFTLVILLFAFGCGMSSMDVSMNEQAVLVERKTDKTLMSSFHAAYSIGGLSGSLVSAGMASRADWSPLMHFCLAVILFGSIVFMTNRYLLRSDQEALKTKTVFHLPERALWGLGLIAFLSAMGEHTIGDWSALYLTQVIQTSAAFAALGYGAFSLTMTIGRLLGDYLSSLQSPAFIVRIGGLTACAGFLVAVVSRNPYVVLAGFAITGVGLSNIIPMIFRVAGNQPGINAGAGIASVATIGYMGFLVGPPFIGFIAEVASLRTAMLIIGLLAGSLIFIGRTVSLPDHPNNENNQG